MMAGLELCFRGPSRATMEDIDGAQKKKVTFNDKLIKRRQLAQKVSCCCCPLVYLCANATCPLLTAYCLCKRCIKCAGCYPQKQHYDHYARPNKCDIFFKYFDPCVGCCPRTNEPEDFALGSERKENGWAPAEPSMYEIF